MFSLVSKLQCCFKNVPCNISAVVSPYGVMQERILSTSRRASVAFSGLPFFTQMRHVAVSPLPGL